MAGNAEAENRPLELKMRVTEEMMSSARQRNAGKTDSIDDMSACPDCKGKGGQRALYWGIDLDSQTVDSGTSSFKWNECSLCGGAGQVTQRVVFLSRAAFVLSAAGLIGLVIGLVLGNWFGFSRRIIFGEGLVFVLGLIPQLMLGFLNAPPAPQTPSQRIAAKEL
jgi:hypothetical protein